LLLVTVSYFPTGSPRLLSLATSVPFISGIGTYIGLLDNTLRHCGMLVAEEVAKRAGKNLDFDDWKGDDAGKPWTRDVRMLIKERDSDSQDIGDEDVTLEYDVHGAEGSATGTIESTLQSILPRTEGQVGYDSDDSLTGYASPVSSRTASPTPSELDEIEKDPTLNAGMSKIPRPVYLFQLGEMLRDTGGLDSKQESQKADKIEIALNSAEDLIRRKSSYGLELGKLRILSTEDAE
jgi:telomere length regulation protein